MRSISKYFIYPNGPVINRNTSGNIITKHFLLVSQKKLCRLISFGCYLYVPLARIDSIISDDLCNVGNANGYNTRNSSHLYYFHSDLSGLPEELTTTAGKLAWSATYQIWGNTQTEGWIEANALPPPHKIMQNLRFQGQYLDRETGLHYNTFRFYDPDIGRFVSCDPIGLEGGLNLQTYSPNPMSWIDPLGWSGVDVSGRPLSSSKYSVWHQLQLPNEQLPLQRPDHFKFGNQKLHEAIKANPELGKALGPGIVKHVQPGAHGAFNSTSPPKVTWHHDAQNPTLLELVPRSQHQAPGPVQATLHPQQGGGFKKLQSGCA